MATLNEAEQLISTMTVGEKAQVLKWIARDFDGSPPGVESDLTIADGTPCIANPYPGLGACSGQKIRGQIDRNPGQNVETGEMSPEFGNSAV